MKNLFKYDIEDLPWYLLLAKIFIIIEPIYLLIVYLSYAFLNYHWYLPLNDINFRGDVLDALFVSLIIVFAIWLIASLVINS